MGRLTENLQRHRGSLFLYADISPLSASVLRLGSGAPLVAHLNVTDAVTNSVSGFCALTITLLLDQKVG
jgi:hypothetical protein